MKTAANKKAVCTQCGGSHYILANQKGFLKASPCACHHCELCNGSGKIYSENDKGLAFVRPCGCAALKKRLDMLSDAGIPAKFISATLDSYETEGGVHHPSQNRAKTVAVDFVKDFEKSNRGLVFMGGPGLGKTHLAVAIIRSLILEKGADCKFVDFFQLLSDIRHGYSRDLSELEIINPYVKSRVLVIDELAKGRNTEWELTILDQIISNRYNAADRITLFTTNYLIDPPKKKKESSLSQDGKNPRVETDSQSYMNMLTRETLPDRIGPRIYSRLTDNCGFVPMEGKDKRKDSARIHG